MAAHFHSVAAFNWHVEESYEVLIWDDIVRGDFERPLLAPLVSTRVYGDFIANGTMFRYIAANARYAGFFLFPILSLDLSAVGGWFIGYLLTALLGLEGVVACGVGLVTGVSPFLVCCGGPADDGVCSSCWTTGSSRTIIFSATGPMSMFASIVLRRRWWRARGTAHWTKS